MKKSLALGACLAAMAFAGAAAADPMKFGGVDVAVNMDVTSDYYFRGVTQSAAKPAIQGGVDATMGLFYAGTWASSIDFGLPKADVEWDVYGGVKPQFAGFAFDVGAIGYLYPGSRGQDHLDYWEGKVAASRAFGPVTGGAAFFYSPNSTGDTHADSYYYELNGAYAVNDKVSLSGAVGYQDFQHNAYQFYTTWNAGVTYALTDHASLDLRYVSNDHHGDYDVGDQFALTLKAFF